jgi:hypothetical protein
VLSINRLSNRVFLKNTAVRFEKKKPSHYWSLTRSGTSSAQGVSKDEQPIQTKNYHYSRCQLYIGEFDVPSKSNSELFELKPYAAFIESSMFIP